MAETVFISGADKGLGYSLTVRFLREGFHVVAGAYTGSSNLLGLQRNFAKALTIVPLDLSNPASIREAARLVAEGTKDLDILINNAGIHPDQEGLPMENLDFDDGHLERTLAVNTFGPLRLTHALLPLLKKGRRKLIVDISSEAGSIADCWRRGEFGYCMSKAALNMQVKILHNALAPNGFRVLAVHPGWMQTDMGGPKAEVPPDRSAEGIFKLATQADPQADLIYLDYRANPLHW